MPWSANSGAFDVLRRAFPALLVLRELREQTGYTVGLGVLIDRHVMYLYRLHDHRHGVRSVDDGVGVGILVPVYCTAVGKAMLASLSSGDRRRIVARLDLLPYGPNSVLSGRELLEQLGRLDPRRPVLSDEEFVAGAREIAIHVPRASGEPPIAVDITVPSSAFTVDGLLERFGLPLCSAVCAIAESANK